MYEVDIYTNTGTIIHNECAELSEVFKIISDSVDIVQLNSIQRL